MKTFTVFQDSAWWPVALVAAILVFVFCAKYEHEKTIAAKAAVTIATQHVEIKAKDAVIRIDQAIKRVDEDTQLAVDQADKATVKQHTAIQQQVTEKEHVIRRSREAAPATPDTLLAEQQELSEVRIDGLWQAYCAAAPTAPDCHSPQG